MSTVYVAQDFAMRRGLRMQKGTAENKDMAQKIALDALDKGASHAAAYAAGCRYLRRARIANQPTSPGAA